MIICDYNEAEMIVNLFSVFCKILKGSSVNVA